MSLDTIVDLEITRESSSPTRTGFGTPLLVGHHTVWIDRLVKEYSTPDDMLDDGFSASHYLYKAMVVAKSQKPSPKTVKIGRRVTPLTQIVTLTPTITTEGHVYSAEIDGAEVTYTVPASATVQSIVEAMNPTFDALASVVATEDNTKITLTGAAAGTPFSVKVTSDGWTVAETTADTTTDDELAAIQAADDEWYGLTVCDSHSKATNLLVAAFIEARKKLAAVQTSDSACLDDGVTTDIMSALQTAAYERTGAWFHRSIGGTEWLAVGILAKQLTYTPGSNTLAFKTVNGVSVDDLSDDEQATIVAKGGNHYTNTGGVNISYPGQVAMGEYYDVIHLIDWTDAEIKRNILFALSNADKIPYTDAGADVFRNVILAVLQLGVKNKGYVGGVYDPAENPDAPHVEIPLVKDVLPADKKARYLPDIDFFATLQGAIHKAKIRGRVAV